MNNIEKLIELKKTELEVKNEITATQKLVIEEAIEQGKKGILANVNGSKVVLKMMPVKAKPTEHLLELQSDLTQRRMELITLDPETRDLEGQIERLKLNLSSLQSYLTCKTNELVCSDPETRDLEAQIKEEESNLVADEFTPQLAVTLAK